ncbi:hypothetical protein [Devosia sp.]|uniref:hypothetical protein n=1 Tax=Devosia sp. TaxID=1871048 RepID=UPI003A91C168
MRLIVRLVGTWMLGVALVLLVIDGTRSLAASTLVITSFEQDWLWVHADSLEAVRSFFDSRFFAPIVAPVFAMLLALPGWLVLAVPGALLGWMGRSRRARVFVTHDRI